MRTSRRAWACGLQALRALALFDQLVEDPIGALLQRVVDVGTAHPAWRSDAQAVETDRKTDAAPARDAKFIGDALPSQHDLALCARVLQQVGGGQWLRSRRHRRRGMNRPQRHGIGCAREIKQAQLSGLRPRG